MIKNGLFYILMLFYYNGYSANDTVYTLNPALPIHPIRDYSYAFVDSTGKISIDHIVSGQYDSSFSTVDQIKLAPGYANTWFRCKVTSLQPVTDWLLIFNDDPAIAKINAKQSYVDAWMLDSKKNILRHDKSGLLVPRSQKSLHKYPGLTYFPFSIHTGDTIILYLRFYNENLGAGVISEPVLQNSSYSLLSQKSSAFMSIITAIAVLMSFISLIFFISSKEKSYLFFACYALVLGIHYITLQPNDVFISWFIPEHPQLSYPLYDLLFSGTFIFFALFGKYYMDLSLLNPKLNKAFNKFIIISAIFIIIGFFGYLFYHIIIFRIGIIILITGLLLFCIRFAFIRTVYARFYIAGALWLITFTLLGMTNMVIPGAIPFNAWPVGQVGQLFIYTIALGYKLRVNEKAKMEGEISKLKNEELSLLNIKLKSQKEEIENQNIHLEHALNELKKTQTQLIHAEKMASLGQLTAGIAHEIQNPLNFVNNFSELNKELIQELKDEIIKGNNENAMGISMDIEANAIKINHHGQRASSIVKNMLEHSRTSTGKKELTDINGLAEECLKLAYHAFLSGRQGWRVKDSHDEMHQTFHVDLVTNLDTSIPLLNINKQDLGRALLNIFNNAFQAVSENHSLSDHAASPGVQLVTKMVGDKIQVSVIDNGPGIPDSIKEKIFQPFFTTKPTGQGTGLGLSLAYDIVKAHGGTILVDSTVGKGSTFVITIPVI